MIVSSRRTAMLVCGYALLAAIVCAVMAAAAVLFKAPAGVVPLIALSCVVLPILAPLVAAMAIGPVKQPRSWRLISNRAEIIYGPSATSGLRRKVRLDGSTCGKPRTT